MRGGRRRIRLAAGSKGEEYTADGGDMSDDGFHVWISVE